MSSILSRQEDVSVSARLSQPRGVAEPKPRLSLSVRAELGSTAVCREMETSVTCESVTERLRCINTRQVTVIGFRWNNMCLGSFLHYGFHSHENLCPPSHKSSNGSLNISVLIVTSHSCDFSYNQRCMIMLPALRTDEPYARSHTQTVKDNLAQVAQSNLGRRPRHIRSLLLPARWNGGTLARRGVLG